MRVYRLPQVREATGLSRTMIYEERSKGRFPDPIQLGPRCVGWLADEIDAWIRERPRKTKPAKAGDVP
jgi:prophage regulatory protein